MLLSEIDGVVNLFSVRRAKERHLIFGACCRDRSARCEIKFSGGQTAPSAQQRPEFWAALVVAFLVFYNININIKLKEDDNKQLKDPMNLTHKDYQKNLLATAYCAATSDFFVCVTASAAV